MQIYLHSLLSKGAADITGLMSAKVKVYVGKISVTQNSASMKFYVNLVMAHLKA